MLTMDATGRILEQHGNILRPTDGFCMIVPAAEVTLEMKDKQIAYHKEAVTARPKWFIGWPVHQYFSEWNGVCRGRKDDRISLPLASARSPCIGNTDVHP